MVSRKAQPFCIFLLLVVGCSQHSARFELSNLAPLKLMCSFAEKTQIFETSLVLEGEQLEGSLTVFDLRHKAFLEKITGPVAHEDGFWVIRSIEKSDSVKTSREHRINQSTLFYERKTFVQMGNTPPFTSSNQGKCVPI